MNQSETRSAADQVGKNAVASTQAMSDAVSHTCATISTLIKQADLLNQPDVARREMKRLHSALGVILDARSALVHARIGLLRLAQKLEIADYGENCPCGIGSIGEEPESGAPGRLALVV